VTLSRFIHYPLTVIASEYDWPLTDSIKAGGNRFFSVGDAVGVLALKDVLDLIEKVDLTLIYDFIVSNYVYGGLRGDEG